MADDTILKARRTNGAEFTAFVEGDPERNPVGSVNYSITRSETHSVQIDWTAEPIEDGSVVTDHGVVQQVKVQVTGAITATPSGATSDNAGTDLLDFARESLFTIARDKNPVELVTGLTYYPELYISNLVITRDQSSGQSMNVSIDLTELVKVEAQLIDVPAGLFPANNPAPSLKPQADPPQDGGTQTGEQVDNPGGGESSPDGSGKEPKSLWRKMEDGGAGAWNAITGGF